MSVESGWHVRHGAQVSGVTKWLVGIGAAAVVAAILLGVWGPYGHAPVMFTPWLSIPLLAVLVLAAAVLPILLYVNISRVFASSRRRAPQSGPVANLEQAGRAAESPQAQVTGSRTQPALAIRAAEMTIGILLLLLWWSAVAFTAAIALLDENLDCSRETVGHAHYYRCGDTSYAASYSYHEDRGLVMTREGIPEHLLGPSGQEDGPAQDAPDPSNPENPASPVPPADPDGPMPDSTPSEGSSPDGGLGPGTPITGSIDSSMIVETQSVGHVTFGLAEVDATLGGRGAFVAVASRDGGKTWQARGSAGTDVSWYSYFVVNERVQVAGFGTSSEDEAPPAVITYDGGWNWQPLDLPFADNVPAGARFIESVELVQSPESMPGDEPQGTQDKQDKPQDKPQDETSQATSSAIPDGTHVEIVANYPDWVAGRGEGWTFTSEDAVTWVSGP